MATRLATNTIHIDPNSEAAQLLRQAVDEPALLEVNGTRFRVLSEDSDTPAPYDPERVRAAIRQMTGTLKGVDAEAFIAELRAQRGQDSIGRSAH